MARSRSPSGADRSGDSTRAAASSMESVRGSRRGGRGDSRCSVGSRWILRAARAEPTPPQLGQVLAQIAELRRADHPPAPREKRREAREVSAIRRKGMGGGAPLGLQGGEELAEHVHQSLRCLNAATPRWRPFRPTEAVTGAYPTHRRSMTKSITRSPPPARSAGDAACRRAR